jgi:hypothetical protein
MTLFLLTFSVMFIAYWIGYLMGRKQIIDEIKQLTKELKEK